MSSSTKTSWGAVETAFLCQFLVLLYQLHQVCQLCNMILHLLYSHRLRPGLLFTRLHHGTGGGKVLVPRAFTIGGSYTVRMEARRPIQRRLDGRHHGLDIPGQYLNQIFLQSSWHSLRRRHLRLHTHSRHSLLLLLAVPVLPAIPAVPAVLLPLPCRDFALSALTVQMPLTTLHFANGAVFACETM